MTLPTTTGKLRMTEDNPVSCTPFHPDVNSYFSTLFSHLTSTQLQQQLFFTQLLLSGATCPPLNPLANALQLLLTNNSHLSPQQNTPHPDVEPKKKSHHSSSTTKSKFKQQNHNVSTVNDSSPSDTNEKSTFDEDDNSPTIASTLATLPGNPTETTASATTVDGINLQEIKQFAKAFKLRRLALGLTQTQVGQALSVTRGPAYSQSAICRFEKLDITPKSASKIKPVLEKWMQEAEIKYGDRLKHGPSNIQDLLNDLSTKKRKRRTSFTPQALDKLNDAFELNSHPSGFDMSSLAQQLNYDREVIRVWFCNKRQALKNSAKKCKTNSIHGDTESTTSSSTETKLLDATNRSTPEHPDSLS